MTSQVIKIGCDVLVTKKRFVFNKKVSLVAQISFKYGRFNRRKTYVLIWKDSRKSRRNSRIVEKCPTGLKSFNKHYYFIY